MRNENLAHIKTFRSCVCVHCTFLSELELCLTEEQVADAQTKPRNLTTIMNSSRRNGKPASCEPCRLNKTKCDHSEPKCNRCYQRGIADRCFYHPAPLTRRREPTDEQSHSSGASTNVRSLKRKRTTQRNLDASLSQDGTTRDFTDPPLPQDHCFTDAVAAETYRPGFLGPTSYEAILPKDDDFIHALDREASVASGHSDHELSHQHPLTKSTRMQMATDVLTTLRHYALIQETVVAYDQTTHTSVIPTPMEVDIVNALKPIVDRFNLAHSTPDPRLAAMVLENTSRPLHLTPDLKARDFYQLCSGDNIRFEIVGFLLSTAGLSLWFGCTSDLLDESKYKGIRSRLIDEMLRASTICLTLCSLISPVSDLMIWLFLGNYVLTSVMCGITSPPSWRRIGELSTQIYALGLHKESSNSNLPAWLLETRRRVFCSSYNQDKTISTFLGRPIRISKRHTDVKLPLDLSDKFLVGDQATFENAKQDLGEAGWNTKGCYSCASWVRLRYISNQHREEILDFALAKLDDEVERKLLDISRRIRESWAALPSHLRYWPGCWDEDVPPSVCFMLMLVYLTHFYNEFMIQKLLDSQPLTFNLALLRVSVDLLSNCMTLSTIRDRTYDIQRDFLHAMIIFGIPAGSVLASALREQHRSNQAFPPSISRAEIIRMLSVLISHLDAAPHVEASGARPGDANYKLCRKASKAFTKVVDSVLDSQPVSSLTPTGGVNSNLSIDLDLDLDIFSAPGLDAFERMDFVGGSGGGDGVGDEGIDWGALGQWTF